MTVIGIVKNGVVVFPPGTQMPEGTEVAVEPRPTGGTNDASSERAELVESLDLLDRSQDDVKAGRTRPAKAGIRQIADSLNLPLDR